MTEFHSVCAWPAFTNDYPWRPRQGLRPDNSDALLNISEHAGRRVKKYKNQQDEEFRYSLAKGFDCPGRWLASSMINYGKIGVLPKIIL
jgi:hypothetical protein